MKRTLLLASLLTGCAWSPGAGFATLVPGGLTAEWPAPKGRLSEGVWLTANGYRLRDLSVTLTLGEVSLLAPGSSSGGTGGTFDPARPPVGYSLCHNGHCHRSDGALIDYAAIQAEMTSGRVTTPVTVARLAASPTTGTLSPGQSPTTLMLEVPQPSAYLGAGTLNQATLGLARARFVGTVEAGPGLSPLPGGQRPFAGELTLDSASLTGAVNATLDRRGPGSWRLSGRLAVSDTLFDHIDWSRLAAASGAIDPTRDAESAEALRAGLAATGWTPQLTPQP